MAKYWQLCKQHFRETPHQKVQDIKHQKYAKGYNNLTCTFHASRHRQSPRQDSKGCSKLQNTDKSQGGIAKDVPCVKTQIKPNAG